MTIEKPLKQKSKAQMRRRSKFVIAIEVLLAIQELRDDADGTSRLTRVQGRVIIGWNPLKNHIIDLEQKGLIETGRLRLTPAGQKFLQEYRQSCRPVFEKYGFLG
jgi:predicted transcriptional regulator